MRDVWFMFKLVEAILSIICMGIHIDGFLYSREPLPHHMYFCGTFFGFTIISIIGDVGLCTGASTPFLIEAVIASFGSFFYILSSVFSMYHAEIDFHLMYLSDLEEAEHRFFATSKAQSISSLVCGITYLLHAIFSVDALLITEEDYQKRRSTRLSAYHISDDEQAKKPLHLNLFCFKMFEQFSCFEKCMERIMNESDSENFDDTPRFSGRSFDINKSELGKSYLKYREERDSDRNNDQEYQANTPTSFHRSLERNNLRSVQQAGERENNRAASIRERQNLRTDQQVAEKSGKQDGQRDSQQAGRQATQPAYKPYDQPYNFDNVQRNNQEDVQQINLNDSEDTIRSLKYDQGHNRRPGEESSDQDYNNSNNTNKETIV